MKSFRHVKTQNILEYKRVQYDIASFERHLKHDKNLIINDKDLNVENVLLSIKNKDIHKEIVIQIINTLNKYSSDLQREIKGLR